MATQPPVAFQGLPEKCRKMSLESVEEVETAPSGSLEEVSTTSAECESGAPRPRRKSLSKLRRRLSRTFRLSFSGSLSDFAQTFTIDERGEYPDPDSATKSLDAEDILPSKLNGKSELSLFRFISFITLFPGRLVDNESYVKN